MPDLPAYDDVDYLTSDELRAMVIRAVKSYRELQYGDMTTPSSPIKFYEGERDFECFVRCISCTSTQNIRRL